MHNFTRVDLFLSNSDTDWRQAPENELVRLDDMPNILFTNQTTVFVCEAIKFLFLDELEFELEYKNGSREVLHYEDGNSPVDLSEKYKSHNRRSIRRFNVLHILEIELPLNAVAVHCGALLANTMEVIWSKRTFEVRGINFSGIYVLWSINHDSRMKLNLCFSAFGAIFH